MVTAKIDLCEIHSLGNTTREWLVSSRQVPAFARSWIDFAGYSEAGRGYRFVRHAPSFSQILACNNGEGRALVGGKWVCMHAGDIYLTPARSLCAYQSAPGKRWQISWVIYNMNAQLPGLEAGLPPRIIEADTFGLSNTIEGLCHETSSASDPGVTELWATLIHRHILRILQPSPTDPRIARLWQTVRKDLAGTWDLDRMAHCAGMSPESLRRLSLEHHGEPPLRHLTKLRLHYAADLLACTREKVSSIAARVGYEDAFAFSNAFKRVIGHPPSRQRDRQK